MAAMRSLRLACGFLAALAITAAAGCAAEPRDTTPRSEPASQPAQPPSPAAPSTEPAPQSVVPRGYAGPLPPLPQVPFPPARPPEVVQAVYAFAARHPEVLHHVPCFCGCERQGHRGNDDCFVASRDGEGRPRWEMHGYV
jgi:hypothetical protein